MPLWQVLGQAWPQACAPLALQAAWAEPQGPLLVVLLAATHLLVSCRRCQPSCHQGHLAGRGRWDQVAWALQEVSDRT